MSILGRLLSYLSIAVNLLLSLTLLGLGLIATAATGDMNLELVPDWAGSVTNTVILAGIVGLAAVILAFRPSKLARTGLVIWSLLVTWTLAGPFWSSSYRFDGMDGFTSSLWIWLGSVLLLIGSWMHRKAAAQSA